MVGKICFFFQNNVILLHYTGENCAGMRKICEELCALFRNENTELTKQKNRKR